MLVELTPAQIERLIKLVEADERPLGSLTFEWERTLLLNRLKKATKGLRADKVTALRRERAHLRTKLAQAQAREERLRKRLEQEKERRERDVAAARAKRTYTRRADTA